MTSAGAYVNAGAPSGVAAGPRGPRVGSVSDLATAVRAAYSAALVVPAPDRACLVVRGADRVTWLNGLVTCDVTKLEAGRAMYGLSVRKKGRIFVDLVIVADRDAILALVPAPRAEEVRAELEHYLVMEDAELALEPRAATFVHGPRALEVARCATGATVAELDTTGLGGAVVIAPAGADAAVAEALARAAEKAGGVVGEEAAWESLRLERGVPRYGADFDETTYPQEASLEKRAVSFQKGCYLGQEVVCMLELRGHVKRKLVSVRLGGDVAPGTPLLDADGTEVGALTSSAPSPSLGVPLGFAMVKRALAVPGTVLRAGAVEARVMEGPEAR
jgi:folate-binding protein YgfZ